VRESCSLSAPHLLAPKNKEVDERIILTGKVLVLMEGKVLGLNRGCMAALRLLPLS
jgi:hypothetical protein